MNQHDFKPGDRAIVLPKDTSDHCFESMSIVEYILHFFQGTHEFIGRCKHNNKRITQMMFLDQVQKLQPHHTGLPDYLDAE